jgi:endoribonuclease Dicer
MYTIKCENVGHSKDPFLTQVSDFAVLFGTELDAEVVVSICITASRSYLSIITRFLPLITFVLQVLSMSMDLFIARTVTTKASLVFRESIDITESQVNRLTVVYTFSKCS